MSPRGYGPEAYGLGSWRACKTSVPKDCGLGCSRAWKAAVPKIREPGSSRACKAPVPKTHGLRSSQVCKAAIPKIREVVEACEPDKAAVPKIYGLGSPRVHRIGRPGDFDATGLYAWNLTSPNAHGPEMITGPEAHGSTIPRFRESSGNSYSLQERIRAHESWGSRVYGPEIPRASRPTVLQSPGFVRLCSLQELRAYTPRESEYREPMCSEARGSMEP